MEGETKDQKQLELLYAIVKLKGTPAGKGDWEQIADMLADKPNHEGARSRWRKLEPKLKEKFGDAAPVASAVPAEPVEGGAVKKPRATPKKKTGEPSTPKKPRAKKVKSAEKVEENQEVDGEQDFGGDGQQMNVGLKRSYEDYAAPYQDDY